MRVVLSLLIAMILAASCSSIEVNPPPPLPEPPDYVRVPHPEGLDIADLNAIFSSKEAPETGSLKGCDADLAKLRSLTANPEELAQGARELVRSNPVGYHWCFYRQILDLEHHLKEDNYFDERQKHVVEVYLFLTPIARAFIFEFGDSRYLRWAIARYRRLSEFVFFRKVEIAPRMSSDLIVNSADPIGFVRTTEPQDQSMLEKYGLAKTGDVPMFKPYGGKKTRAPASLTVGDSKTRVGPGGMPVTDVEETEGVVPQPRSATE